LHRRSTLRPLPATNFQLPWRLHPFVSPSAQPPTCVGCRSSGLPSGPTSILRRLLAFQLTFQSTSDSRRISHRPVLPSNPPASFRRLTCPPAFLSDRPSTRVEYRILQFCLPTKLRLIIGYRVSDFTIRSASDLRRRSTFQLCLPTNLPTCAGRYVLRLPRRTSLRLASAAAFSGSVSDQPSTSFGV